MSVPGAWRRNESLGWRLIDDRCRPVGSSGLVWVLLSVRVQSLFMCFGNSSMVLVGLGSMNDTLSECLWAKNYLKRCGLCYEFILIFNNRDCQNNFYCKSLPVCGT